MQKHQFLAATLCALILAGCDSEDLASGGGSTKFAAEEVAMADQAAAGDGNTIVLDPVDETPGQPSEKDEQETFKTPPKNNPPDEGKADSCGAGNYVFVTDSDGKRHFDARFEANGNIRYNFTVQPNRGNWRISGNQMIFNGPFGAGNSDHTFSWTITSRSSDCKVQRFQGKSIGNADVTASRF